MKKLGFLLLPLLMLLAFVSFPRVSRAQDQQAVDQASNQPQEQSTDQADQDQTVDPPGRVARLSYMQGSVSYQVSGDQDWVAADPNRPLTTGDNLWADQNSRAELHIGSTAIRLSSQTGISILTLDDRTAQIQLPQGTIEIHLRDQIPGDAFEIDTPNIALTMAASGEYVISTDPNGSSTSVVVREGEIQATGAGQDYRLGAGQRYTFKGTDELSYDAQAAPGFDDFENWCQDRDQRENSSVSARYVSRDVDGVYDLDQYGAWDSVSDYGEVWFPRGVAVDWAPYRYGHWIWIAPWGWTWVESEPWGFAPFHYGRWVAVGARWGWVPGPMVVRPIYAPAVVGFVGGGRLSLSVSFGGGLAGVAWFPLGPLDVYVPAYRCSARYVQTLNVTNTRVVNVTNITNVYNSYQRNVRTTNVHYAYENNARAVTVVSRETFVNARPVAKSLVRVQPQQIARARVAESAPIAPVRASYVSSQARRASARPATPFANRPTVVRLSPAAPVTRVQRPIYTNESRPFNGEPARTNNAQPPARANNAQPARGAGSTNGAEQPARNGARPFQPPPNRATAQPQQNNNGRIQQNARPQENNRPQNDSRPAETYRPQQNTHPQQNSRPQTNNRPAEVNRPREQPREQQPARPPVRYAPPVRANDKMYDVHPPLNQRPAAQPRRQESRPAAKSQPAHPHSSHSK
ncbi:MAG TPA: DUF6600 domain-containing protein [Candidatus Acidoferrales bacterium]|nr:DUF6600 domain-containing protein [Candidatus Acidoferrales bacterium]